MAHKTPFLVADLGPTLSRSCCTYTPPSSRTSARELQRTKAALAAADAW
jgi:hypothetical protein